MNRVLIKNGDKLPINDEQELHALTFIVPGRDEGRRSYHTERNGIIEYLKALSKYNLICFPILIEKSESPDFIVQTGTGFFGVEFTEASTEAFQCAMSKLALSEKGTFLDDSLFKLSEGLTSREISRSFDGVGDKTFFLKPGNNQKLIGQGWENNEPEQDWAIIVTDVIQKKTKLLNKPHFNLKLRAELLIYDNTHAGIFVKPLEGMVYLANELDKRCLVREYPRLFDRISVMRGKVILYDITKTKQILGD